ncbi:MAG: hypothetical protein M5U28_51405 [Sandaracinaceae bacterium]|nr:hypothetical protein [Sandaracinaceae bacterium]
MGADRLERGEAVLRLRDQVEAGEPLDRAREALPYERVVVRDQNPHPLHPELARRDRAAATSMQACTRGASSPTHPRPRGGRRR